MKVWCYECDEEVSMVTVEQATAMTGMSGEIHRLIEAGQIHFAETTEGSVLICLNSLLRNN